MQDVKIIEDSIGCHGQRITTFQLVYPRIIHSELLTHRVFSRNASSTRAIPSKKLAETAKNNMFMPTKWLKNQPGMQAMNEELDEIKKNKAIEIWKNAAEACSLAANELSELGLHKQWAGRMTEWFGNISVVLTATEFDNWYLLRDHKDAQPEIRELAREMRQQSDLSVPKLLHSGEWHLPYISHEERRDPFFTQHSDSSILQKISAARCCRVSYLKHDGNVATIDEDLTLLDKLMNGEIKHMSPFEHAAECASDTAFYFNLNGFKSYRYHMEC